MPLISRAWCVKDAQSGVCDQTSMDARNTKLNPAKRFIGSSFWPAHEQPKATPEAPQRDFSVGGTRVVAIQAVVTSVAVSTTTTTAVPGRTDRTLLSELTFILQASRPGLWLTSIWFYMLPLGGRNLFGSIPFWLGVLYMTFPMGLL